MCCFIYLGLVKKKDAPEEVYLIPSKAIYEYNRSTGEIKFLNTLEGTSNKDQYKDYQAILDNTKVQYKLSQS